MTPEIDTDVLACSDEYAMFLNGIRQSLIDRIERARNNQSEGTRTTRTRTNQ